MFGLELRRKASIGNLYNDVNVTLARSGITQDEIPADVCRVAVGTSL